MSDKLHFIELQLAVLSHCVGLKAVVALMEQENYDAAMARLEGTLAALEAVVKVQALGKEFRCQECGELSPVIEWAIASSCPKCNAPYDEST